MKYIIIVLIGFWMQNPVATVTRFNGDEVMLTKIKIFQEEKVPVQRTLKYSYRGQQASIDMDDIKRISLKEALKRRKGITTYRVILVEKNNDKLEVELNLVRIEGSDETGKLESINFSSVEKISF